MSAAAGTPERWTARGTCIHFGDGGIDIGGAPDPERRARLIAAAPELLEAANAALAYDVAIRGAARETEAAGRNYANSDELDRLYEDWLGKSRAAIAKATGAAS